MKRYIMLLILILCLSFITACTDTEEPEKTLYFNSKAYNLEHFDEETNTYEFKYIGEINETVKIKHVIENQKYTITIGDQQYELEVDEENNKEYTVTFPNEDIWYCNGAACGSSNSDFHLEYVDAVDFDEIHDYFNEDQEASDNGTNGDEDGNDVRLIIFGVVFIPFGLLSLFAPDLVWELEHLFKGWMYRDKTPSRTFYTYAKVSGIIMLFVGTGLILIYIIL